MNIKILFDGHRRGAKRRGIGFDFSFEEWVKWWEYNIGPDWPSLRGKKRGQYCMARKGDKGSYEINNVECKLVEENCNDRAKNGTAPFGENNGTSKLTEKQVLEIFFSDERDQNVLAERYGVVQTLISQIWRKTIWKHILNDKHKERSTIRKDCRSGVTGVSWNNSKKQWTAKIRTKILGSFASKDDAIAARKQAENNLD